MTTIYADDLRPGDVVDYHGELHRITHIERCDGWAWPVAYDDAGWAMALGHDPVDVRREQHDGSVAQAATRVTDPYRTERSASGDRRRSGLDAFALDQRGRARAAEQVALPLVAAELAQA